MRHRNFRTLLIPVLLSCTCAIAIALRSREGTGNGDPSSASVRPIPDELPQEIRLQMEEQAREAALRRTTDTKEKEGTSPAADAPAAREPGWSPYGSFADRRAAKAREKALLLRSRIRDESLEVAARIQAWDRLLDLGQVTAEDMSVLLDLMALASHERERAMVVKLLAAADHPQAVEIFLRLIATDPSPHVRGAAARGLSSFPIDPGTRTLMEQALASEEHRMVREALMRSLRDD